MTKIAIVCGLEGITNRIDSATPGDQFQVTDHRLQLGYITFMIK